MRYLAILFCFSLSLAVFYLTKSESKPESVDLSVEPTTTRIVEVATNPPQTPSFDNYLAYQGDESVKYGGFLIENSKKGLSVSRGGRRLLFVKNEYVGENMNGRFGLRSLLGDDERQLIYETRTGGNHCCIYHSIIDLSGSSPRFIFRSGDFDVFGGPWLDDPLGLFDADEDGVMELTQSDTFYMEDGIMAANPVVDIGFKYDRRARKYLPSLGFAPGSELYISKLKTKIASSNGQIVVNDQPDSVPWEYEPDLIDVCLNYVFVGRSKEGFEYLKNNTLAYAFVDGTFRYDPSNSKSKGDDLAREVRSHLKELKIYKMIRQR